jgi:hypothetical protein
MKDTKELSRFLCIFCFLFSAVLTSCKNDLVDSADENKAIGEYVLENANKNIPLEEFVRWATDKEHKLVKDKKISEINYQLAFIPMQSMAYLELKNDSITKKKFEEAENHYKEMSYFKFRIELIGGSGELLKYNLESNQQYSERINYMSFKMQKDIFLVQGRDTLSPGLFEFERIFEIAPYATVMFAFDKKKFSPESEFTIIYNDRLFKKGLIKYNYRPKLLIDLPNISGV